MITLVELRLRWESQYLAGIFEDSIEHGWPGSHILGWEGMISWWVICVPGAVLRGGETKLAPHYVEHFQV